jgi:hypothetical protein
VIAISRHLWIAALALGLSVGAATSLHSDTDDPAGGGGTPSTSPDFVPRDILVPVTLTITGGTPPPPPEPFPPRTVQVPVTLTITGGTPPPPAAPFPPKTVTVPVTLTISGRR